MAVYTHCCRAQPLRQLGFLVYSARKSNYTYMFFGIFSYLGCVFCVFFAFLFVCLFCQSCTPCTIWILIIIILANRPWQRASKAELKCWIGHVAVYTGWSIKTKVTNYFITLLNTGRFLFCYTGTLNSTREIKWPLQIAWYLKQWLQLRFDYDTTTIRRYHDAFDYDGSDRNYDLRSIRLQYEYDTTTTKN